MSVDDTGSPRSSGPRRPPRPPRPADAASADEVAAASPVAASPYDDPDIFSGEVPTVARRRPEPDDGHDYVDLPPERRLPRGIAALLVVGLIILVLVGGGWWWYQRQVDPPGPQGDAVEVVVPEGSSVSRIADLLANEGVVENGTLFNLFLGRKEIDPFQAGTYRLHANSSFEEALADLEKGPSKPAAAKTTKVTIPEGYTVAQILRRINEKVPRLKVEEMQALLDQGKVPTTLKPAGVTSYEGLLFPATYDVGTDTTALELLTAMAGEMEGRVDRLGIEAARTHIKQQWGLDLTAYDMLKAASMIQYEAAVPADAPKIAAVTYNRLEQGIPLGFDSTSIYEAGLTGSQPDYESDTPYNTRVNTGLPPTPIAAPGEMALEGAMQPADGDWLYFVLTDTDEVTFTVSYEDFLRAKEECKRKDLGCG